jgi:hypothetical protein
MGLVKKNSTSLLYEGITRGASQKEDASTVLGIAQDKAVRGNKKKKGCKARGKRRYKGQTKDGELCTMNSSHGRETNSNDMAMSSI